MTTASDVPQQHPALDIARNGNQIESQPLDAGPNGHLAEPGTAADRLFAGAGAVPAVHRATDWSRTPLGPAESWPTELAAAIRTVLASDVPMLIWWGPEFVQIYNEAYADVIGDKHPAAVGQPGAECWAEVWPLLSPWAQAVLDGQGSRHSENLMMLINRSGYEEETYWTFSYSPITAASGEVVGVLVATSDTTHQVVYERRLKIIRDLGAVSVSNAPELVCREALQVVSEHRSSMPFAAVYLRDVNADAGEPGSRLVASFGLDPASAELPSVLNLPDAPAGAGRPRTGPGTAGPDGSELVMVPAAQLFPPDVRLAASPLGTAAPSDLLLLPLRPAGSLTDLGVLVLGRNPYRRPDHNYRTFCELLARQINVALTDALAYDAERRRAQALSEADEAKSRFLQDVSHEFRTPLTMMMGPLDTVLTDPRPQLPDDIRAGLELSQRALLRLRGMVDALLDFARAESGELEPRPQTTDLAGFVRDLAGMFGSIAESAGLGLVVDADSVTEPALVDREMLAQILSNLLSNAIKFTAQGSITVRLERDGEVFRLVVSDTGMGIAPDELPKIFDRFHRVDIPGARSREGAGIGLSLVCDLARVQGGRVAVQSTVGQGSSFTVELPWTPAANDGEASSEAEVEAGHFDLDAVLTTARSWIARPGSEQAALAPATGPTTGRLLLVEDSREMRAYLTQLFVNDGWSVDAAGSVDEALALTELPDIVVADVMLPGRSGIDLVSMLRGTPATQRLPILLLTAQAGPEAAEHGLRAGADDYVVKPFAPSELLARVRTHHELAQLREVALGEAEAKVVNLQKALTSNRQIGTALGILMSRQMVTAEQAFDLLRSVSQTHHRKLRDIAEDVILTGELPGKAAAQPADSHL